MSADGWIKLRTKLPRDGRLRVASRVCHALGVTEYRTTVTLMLGAIATLWCLADEHADADGVLTGYTADAVDAEVGVPGFCEALPPEWIDLTGQWVKLPEYQEHNGTTGKSRAQATKRKRKERAVTGVADVSRNDRDASVTREEKRREDSPVGNTSERVQISNGARSEGGQAGASAGEGVPGPSTVTDDQAGAAVRAAVLLRRIGMRCQPQDPNLLALAAEGFAEKELALVAAEKALKVATLWNDPDVHPELHELLASGATQQQMNLTGEQYTAVRSAAADVGTGYLAATLRGRRRDAHLAAAENAAGRATTRGKPSATDNFEGKTYAGTDIDKLAPEFRAALERDHAASTE